MSQRKKVRFFFRYFLSAFLVVMIGAYFKVNQHEHADIVLTIALLYSLAILTSFMIYNRKRKRSARVKR